MAVLIGLLSFLVVVLSVLYLRFKKIYLLWSRLGVSYLEPTFPFGNFRDSLKNRHFGVICQDLYVQAKKFSDFCGIFMFAKPTLLVTSPEFAKTILVKDFNTFRDRGVYFNPKDDPLSANVFFIEGNDWKMLRQNLSPAFTSEKMKTMLHAISDVGEQLKNKLEEEGVSGSSVDIKDLMACYTTDVISSCVFGLDGSSIKNPNSEFRKVGKKVMNISKVRSFLTFVGVSFRDLFRQCGFRTFDQESTEFFSQMVHKTIGFRRENNLHIHDLMQNLIELMRPNSEKREVLTIDEVAANAFIFFFAGFETSSTTLTFALHNLSVDTEIQEKARIEILRILGKYDGHLTYEAIGELDYLDRILKETLRIYPTVASLHRIADRTYTLPTGVEIPKGTCIVIPVLGIHHDPQIYPNPEKFDPDRFTDENKASRHPYAYLPFGEGPRMCVGMRFAMLQMKVALATLLRNFKFEVSAQTDVPLKIDPVALTYVPRNVYLTVRKI